MKIKQNAIFIAILLLTVLICGTLYLWSGDTVAHIPSGDGTRDLLNADFSSGSFDLSGPVEYIPNALLTPDEFEAGLDEALTGDPADFVSYSTGRLRVYVPIGTYGLMMWNAGFATNIFIGGQPVESVGVPSGDAKRSITDSRFLYYTANAPNEVIEIVQQASDYVLRERGSHAHVVIGTPETVRKMYTKQNAIPAVVIGCFLVFFLAHLLLYSMLRLYKANLWFAL